MTRNQLTRKRLEKIQSWRDTYGAGSNVMLPAEEAEELARMALAAMDGEPVAEVCEDYAIRYISNGPAPKEGLHPSDKLYHHAQPAPELIAIVERLNLSGYEYEDGEVTPQNAAAVVDTLLQQLDDAVQSPDAQPAPVVVDERAAFNAWNNEDNLPIAGVGAKNAAWLAWQARAKLAGNSPVIPEGYVMVPMRLTAENGAKGVLSGEFSETKFVNCPECFGDDECETCDGSGRIEIKVPVTWTTIKDIWIKGVEHFAAAPQENK